MQKVCKHLFEDIQFFYNKIIPCGTIYDINLVKKYFININAEQNENPSIDFSLYKDLINKYVQQYMQGEKPAFCEGCNFYEPVDTETINTTEGFKNLYISHKVICSCRCIYCGLANGGKMYGFKQMSSQKSYDIRPILAQIDELNLIQNGAMIHIYGGECTEYPEELEAIIDFGVKHDCNFSIETNGIIYNKKIEELISNHNVDLRIPLDSGTKETFDKIKRVDKWEQVIENIENYSRASLNNKNSKISLKYIICPDINDNIRELKAFFEFMVKIKLKHSILTIDKYWLEKNQYNKIPLNLKQLISFYLEDSTYGSIIKDIDYGILPKEFVEEAKHLSVMDKIKLHFIK